MIAEKFNSVYLEKYASKYIYHILFISPSPIDRKLPAYHLHMLTQALPVSI